MTIANAVFPQLRMRRLRAHPSLRALVRETSLQCTDLIFPLFIRHGKEIKNPIASMPGHYQLSADLLQEEIQEIVRLKIPGVILFGIPEIKDAKGSDSYDDANGVMQQAIKTIKQIAPELLILSDVCFCEYTDHGHCGVISDRTGQRDVENDATLTLLAKQAVSHARAGADVIAPSGMIDGMVHAIRQSLDSAGYDHLPILSYAVKYSSALYGPFREASEGAPQFGTRESYQMDPGNAKEAIREVALDVQEGADMLMVKPAAAYLDIVSQVKQHFPHIPLGAYHVSGEYSMVKAAAANGWLDEKRVAMEILTGIKRAGADFIITYFAKDVAKWLQAL